MGFSSFPQGANLKDCCLERADLSRCTLEGATLINCHMVCANLEGSNLRGKNRFYLISRFIND